MFFTNSGSEAVDTALKMAIAYHRARGEGQRTRLIGRERGYHGVNFGGISVGGIAGNRKSFGTMVGGVDHLRHTHDLKKNAFSRGIPEHGAELADDLERIVTLHDASTIAAVIVEPVAGSTGVLLPPKGYLERLRAICDKHGILLIFDEVITGFGRLGSPFAATHFNVTPDLMTVAKGITNGCRADGRRVRQGRDPRRLHDRPRAHGRVPARLHLFGASARLRGRARHARDLCRRRPADARARRWRRPSSTRCTRCASRRHVIDIRNIGLVGGIELESIAGAPGKRAFDIFRECFERGVLIRTTGDIIALSPPLIVEESHIDQAISTIADVLKIGVADSDIRFAAGLPSPTPPSGGTGDAEERSLSENRGFARRAHG